jgi:tetratricopeptide (TPR) repeat protein
MIWLAVALAEQPFPAYDEIVVLKEWEKLDSLIEAACSGPMGRGRLCAPEPLDEAIARGTTFQENVVADARIAYLVGLAQLQRGHRDAARKSFDSAVAQDPDRLDAWNDLGEMALEDGDLARAEEAFQTISVAIPHGSQSWLGPWRLAEIAAHRRRPERFEEQMRLALERGFSFRQIRGLPNWKGFMADPVMGPSVRKLLTVYASADVLESLEP